MTARKRTIKSPPKARPVARNRTGELREDWTLIMSRCYSQELSACPKHPIFQPQKAINLLLKACKEKGLRFVPREWILKQDSERYAFTPEFNRRDINSQIEEIEIEENTD